MRRYIFYLLLLLNLTLLKAQQDSMGNKFTLTQKLITTGIVAQQVASFYIEYNWWWRHNYHPFNLQNDGGFNNYSKGIDKLGHFYISYSYYHIINQLMQYGNFSKKATNITAVTLPAIWALSIEIGDGFSSYAFNPDDLLANYLGILLGLAQTNVKQLDFLKIKMSYVPSQVYLNNGFKNWSLSADYDGHIYWLTINLNKINPNIFKANVFKYFNIGAGYSLNKFKAYDPNIQREFVIGIDYNLSAIKTKGKTMNLFKNVLDLWHWPSAGVKINAKTGNNYGIILN